MVLKLRYTYIPSVSKWLCDLQKCIYGELWWFIYQNINVRNKKHNLV